jgi:hypothetical protein
MRPLFFPRWATRARVARPLLDGLMVGGDVDPRADGSWEQFDEMVAELHALEATEEHAAKQLHRALSRPAVPVSVRRAAPRRRGTRCRRSAASGDDDGGGGEPEHHRRPGRPEARR